MRHHVTQDPRGRAPRSGATLVELSVVLAVLAIAASMYANLVLTVGRQRQVQRQTAVAAEAAGSMLEVLRSEPFADLHRLYGHGPEDDPDGPGSAPGPRFAVAGLRPLPDAPGATCGEILLPEIEVLAEFWQLREDAEIPELGLPRDLNGDSMRDSANHSQDYALLPVRIRVDWMSVAGPRRFELHTILTEVER